MHSLLIYIVQNPGAGTSDTKYGAPVVPRPQLDMGVQVDHSLPVWSTIYVGDSVGIFHSEPLMMDGVYSSDTITVETPDTILQYSHMS